MKKNIILNASAGLLITVMLFIITIVFVPAFLPDEYLEGSTYYVTLIVMEAVPLGLGIFIYTLISKDKFRDLFIFSPVQFRENKSKLLLQIIIAAAMAVSGYTFVAFTQVVWLKLLDSLGYVSTTDALPLITSFPMFLLGILSVAIVPAVSEEIVFRGILQKGMLRHKKPFAAIAITAFLFMLMHGSIETVIYTFLLGCVIGYLAYSSGSIIPAIAYHAANNAMATIGLYISGAFPDFFNTEGQVGSIAEMTTDAILAMSITAVVSLCFLLVFLWAYSKVSIRPPKNPHLKPVPTGAVVLIVISGVLLFGLMVLIFISTQFS